MQFSEYLWDEVQSIYQSILDHPFNQGLMDGTLDKAIFQFYIKQDSLYLHDFGRGLAMMAARSLDAPRLQQFANFAEGAVVVEKALHEQYFQEFEIEDSGSKSPTCMHYTSFLLSKTAYEEYATGMAALLPCFWIYREVGNHIYANATANNPYQAWIDTYAGEEFNEQVNKAIEITDNVADAVSFQTRNRMSEAFIYSTRLEWMFWDSAYRQEDWPV